MCKTGKELEKAGEVNSTIEYIKNDETSHWILNGCYTSCI
jgi:hypothetical protein